MAWHTGSRRFVTAMSDPRKRRRIRAVAAATAAGLVVTLAQVPVLSASATETAGPVGEQSAGPLSEAEAAAEAARTGREVEVGELTAPTTKVMALPEGGFRAHVSVLPVRVQEDGEWKPVDTTLIRDETGQIVPVRPAVDMEFSPGGDAPLARIADGERSPRGVLARR
jgi:hypothetical protein